MDIAARYRIRASIRDSIKILNSAPIFPDLPGKHNYVERTNRGPVAHIAIERGLKALVIDAGEKQETLENEHGLIPLYNLLAKRREKLAKHLSDAFDDAVKFFHCNTNRDELKHLSSVGKYFERTGGHKDFVNMRYWAIDPEFLEKRDPLSPLMLEIHREVLYAMMCLFSSDRLETVTVETVTERVEREVWEAIKKSLHIAPAEHWQSAQRFIHSVSERHLTFCQAFEEEVRGEFKIFGDEFVAKRLCAAYKDLNRSEDPAVQYYLRRLSYLPKGSECRIPDASPDVEWLDDLSTVGSVVTPLGTPIGSIERYADGAWGIIPFDSPSQERTDIAQRQADAKRYLVHRVTKKVSAMVNGKCRQLRLVDNKSFLSRPVRARDVDVTEPMTYRCDLEFWDSSHGIILGHRVSVQSEGDYGGTVGFEGRAISVHEQRVSLEGHPQNKLV